MCGVWEDDYADGDDMLVMVVTAKRRAKLGKEMKGGKNRGCTSVLLATYTY